MVEVAASEEWEAAATNWFVQTLKMCVEIRPKAKWGYYGLPSRGHSGGQADQPPWSDYAQKQLPIFEASSAIYPSIYLPKDGTTASKEHMIRGLLNMTKVLADQVENEMARRPLVLPFVWEFYAHQKWGSVMLNAEDLNMSLCLPKELGGKLLRERSNPTIQGVVRFILILIIGSWLQPTVPSFGAHYTWLMQQHNSSTGSISKKRLVRL
jgi:hypothetical protein